MLFRSMNGHTSPDSGRLKNQYYAVSGLSSQLSCSVTVMVCDNIDFCPPRQPRRVEASEFNISVKTLDSDRAIYIIFLPITNLMAG